MSEFAEGTHVDYIINRPATSLPLSCFRVGSVVALVGEGRMLMLTVQAKRGAMVQCGNDEHPGCSVWLSGRLLVRTAVVLS